MPFVGSVLGVLGVQLIDLTFVGEAVVVHLGRVIGEPHADTSSPLMKTTVVSSSASA